MLKDENVKKELAEELAKEKGFFIFPSELFSNVLQKHKTNQDDFNQTLATIFKNIESSATQIGNERGFKGIFSDLNLNSDNLGESLLLRNKKLYEVMSEIAKFELNYKDNQIDIFGDAYEYLISMYAADAGKSGGEFFTPQEVSELLARIVIHGQKSINKVYDPACGSGSLLLKFAKILGKDKINQGFFGQEINNTSYNLCRMNMTLHDINFTNFDIAYGDTLTDPNPRHKDTEPFDAIVSNPPYSTKWIGSDSTTLVNDPRFSPAPLAPKSKADLAFVMHIRAWLSEQGVAAVLCFPGVFYCGGAEQKIREYLVRENLIDAIIQLPNNLFFGTNIATCILVMKKNRTPKDFVLFVDASKLFYKDKTKNKLSPEHIEIILKAYQERSNEPHFSYLATREELKQNDYNLSVSNFVEPEDTREKIDIKELNLELKDLVKKQNELRMQIDTIVSELEGA